MTFVVLYCWIKKIILDFITYQNLKILFIIHSVLGSNSRRWKGELSIQFWCHVINTLIEICTKCCMNTVLPSGIGEGGTEEVLFELDFEG